MKSTTKKVYRNAFEKKSLIHFVVTINNNNVSMLKARTQYKLTYSTQLLVIDEIILHLIFGFNSESKTAKVM